MIGMRPVALLAAACALLGAGCTDAQQTQLPPAMQVQEIRADASLFPQGTMQIQATVK